MSLFDLIKQLPARHRVWLGMETDTETGKRLHVAVVVHSPPEGGWPDHDPKAHPAHRFADRVVNGVTAATSADAEKLTEGLIRDVIAKAAASGSRTRKDSGK